MNESKILRTACDSSWYAHAYSEYLADVAQTTSNLMTAIQEVLTYDSLEPGIIESTLRFYGIDPGARFIVGKYGSLTALEIVVKGWNGTDPDNNEDDGLNFSVDELFSTIRGTWAQCVISAKAFDSYSIDVKSSTDRITKFLQDVQAEMNLDDTIRDVISYYQSMINAAPEVSGFVDQFITATGVNTAESSDDEMSYYNSDLSQYTGNTPGIALDFSTANKIAQSTVSMAAKAIKGVFSLVSKGASWLFNKAKKYIVDTVIDPAVCEYVGSDDQNEGFIDGFAWYGEFTPNVTYSAFDTGAQIASIFYNFYEEYATKWIKIKLKFGEFLFRIVDNSNKWQCYFKPVAIDMTYFEESYRGDPTEPIYLLSDHENSLARYNEWLFNVMECIRPANKDADKNVLYRGLAFSNALAGSVALFALLETYGLTKGSYIQGATHSQSQLNDVRDYYSYPDQMVYDVTNSAILTVASGDPGSSTNRYNYVSFSKTTGASLNDSVQRYSMQAIMTHIISIWALCRTERQDNPANYTFVPYSNNHTAFTAPSWRIKTDNAIAATRDNFLSRLILAVVAVAAVAFIGASIIKVSKTGFFKRQLALGQMEQKMWNGQPLTSAERRKYLWYNKRQNACKWLTAGTSDAFSKVSNDSQSIISLIQ